MEILKEKIFIFYIHLIYFYCIYLFFCVIGYRLRFIDSEKLYSALLNYKLYTIARSDPTAISIGILVFIIVFTWLIYNTIKKHLIKKSHSIFLLFAGLLLVIANILFV